MSDNFFLIMPPKDNLLAILTSDFGYDEIVGDETCAVENRGRGGRSPNGGQDQ